MVGVDDDAERTELDRARRMLTDAYELARARGYRPGSPEMLDLERADLHFQHVRSTWRAHRADERPPSEVVLDLREQPRDLDRRRADEAGSSGPPPGRPQAQRS